jgi:hypothetical protein
VALVGHVVSSAQKILAQEGSSPLLESSLNAYVAWGYSIKLAVWYDSHLGFAGGE